MVENFLLKNGFWLKFCEKSLLSKESVEFLHQNWRHFLVFWQNFKIFCGKLTKMIPPQPPFSLKLAAGENHFLSSCIVKPVILPSPRAQRWKITKMWSVQWRTNHTGKSHTRQRVKSTVKSWTKLSRALLGMPLLILLSFWVRDPTWLSMEAISPEEKRPTAVRNTPP